MFFSTRKHLIIITVISGLALLLYSSIYGQSKRQTTLYSSVSRTSPTSNDYRFQQIENESLSNQLQEHIPKSAVPENLPWTIRRINYLPNFYTQAQKNETKQYHDSRIVYLHHNKAAGTTTKHCLLTIAASAKLKAGAVLSSQTRLLKENSWNSQSQRLRPDILMGGYAFGICHLFKDRPCSYFTIFRDPYERLISSYSYCKKARSDQVCSALDANDVSVTEWAHHQGSWFFRQLIFDPVFCSAHLLRKPDLLSMDGIQHNILGSNNLTAAPCWFRQKVFMYHVLNDSQSEALLNYCLDNLERWFAVIGLVEEYETSLTLLQDVYDLPFNRCVSQAALNKNNYLNLEKNNSMKDKSNRAKEAVKHRLKIQLLEDSITRKALEADMKLYEKAKEIFQRQKQIHRERFQ